MLPKILHLNKTLKNGINTKGSTGGTVVVHQSIVCCDEYNGAERRSGGSEEIAGKAWD